ncbi:MAG: transporter [Betaproteobacteria bacterium]|nr:transporter [Betaproteobacteria bacterium]
MSVHCNQLVNEGTQIVKRTLIAAVAILATGPALATEGGGSIYPIGVENYVCCALPPPGVYGMVYAERYGADRVRGNNGQVVTPPTFKVTASAVVPRIVWVTPQTVAGASLAVHAILPVVDLDVDVMPGLRQKKTGIGDMIFGPALGWHHSPQLHTLLALDVFAPTGEFDKNDLVNIGRNYWAIQPIAGISYIDPKGLNADAKVMWLYNLKNKDTNYRSGQEFIVDYAIGWGLGNGWTLGVGGYVYQQINDDKLNGTAVPNNKARAFAIGPSIKFDSGKGWFVTAKYQDEGSVRNRADGAAFWLKAVFPF